MADERTLRDRYVIRRKFFTLLGRAFHICSPNGELALYAHMKAFRLKADIRLYTDEAKQHEVFAIKERQVLRFSPTYDVIDSTVGAKVGALRRHGVRSMVREYWRILDADDNEIGVIRGDSWSRALLRRLLIKIIPQTFICEMDGQPVLAFRQPSYLLTVKTDLDFSVDTAQRLDRRLGISAGLLLSALECRHD